MSPLASSVVFVQLVLGMFDSPATAVQNAIEFHANGMKSTRLIARLAHIFAMQHLTRIGLESLWSVVQV